MTALRVETTDAPNSPNPSAPPRAARRAGAARRQGTAAGQTRRSLQRDLARREASLRISRRASGPVGGVQRSAPVTPPQAQPAPVAQQPVARRAPAAPMAQPAPAVRPAPQRPVARQQAAPARVQQPRVPTQRPAARGVDLRQPAPATAPYGVEPATAYAAAPAQAPQPQPQPAPAVAPARPFVVMPGGAPEAAPGTQRRVSTSAVIISALVAVVLTIGLIVAAQIRVTQMNEQIGSDLATTSQLTQSTTSLKERISALATTARIDDEAQRRQLIEPDPVDVTYLSAGDRAQMADRAARVLRQQPLNPAGGPRSTAPAATAPAATATAPSAATTTTSTTSPTAAPSSVATAPTTTTATTTP